MLIYYVIQWYKIIIKKNKKNYKFLKKCIDFLLFIYYNMIRG